MFDKYPTYIRVDLNRVKELLSNGYICVPYLNLSFGTDGCRLTFKNENLPMENFILVFNTIDELKDAALELNLELRVEFHGS